MRIRTVLGIEAAAEATGAVVVIDVLRAFTTAAYALAAGLDEIELCGTPEEALARPGFRMGEVKGRLIPGFDHNNSPSGLAGRKLSGRGVLRTSAGVQAVLAAKKAETLWLGSLVVAQATVAAIRGAYDITFVASGWPEEGEEDTACALYMESLLRGKPLPKGDIVAQVMASRAAQRHVPGDPDRPFEDLACATALDAFSFSMPVRAGNPPAVRAT